MQQGLVGTCSSELFTIVSHQGGIASLLDKSIGHRTGTLFLQEKTLGK